MEHPFGTVKRQWGFNYILTKQGIQRASSDVGFMFIAYNLRRIINIIGFGEFKKYLEALMQQILQELTLIWLYYLPNTRNYKILNPSNALFDLFINWLRFDQILQPNKSF